ncbi:MAG: cache domain-containing protein [Patescibacteria group bacterium]
MKKITRTITTKTFLLLSLAGLLMLMLVAFVYLFTGKKTRSILSGKILDRQLVTASSGARSIESFIKLTKSSVVLLSKAIEDNLQDQDVLQKQLDDFVSDWDSPTLNGVMVADKDGKIISFSSIYEATIQPNTDISDRDYFSWAKNAQPGEIFLGNPILSRIERKDKDLIIPMSTPIFTDGEFSGVLSVPISLSKITDQYLHPLKVLDSSEIYLLSSEGVVLHSPRSELVGLNFIDRLENEDPFLGAKFIANFAEEKIAERHEGVIDIAYPTTSDNKLLTRMLVAYSPVDYNGAYWMLAVGTPRGEAIAFIAPFIANELGIIIAGSLIFFFFAIIASAYFGHRHGLINHRKNNSQVLESSKIDQDT